MRLPFLQIKQDAFIRAKMLGGYLRVDRRFAMGLQADLWAWGVELTPEGCPEELVGVFMDADPAGTLAAALEWRDGPDHLLTSLIRAGFVELIEGGFRIRGLREVYASALSIPNKRSIAGSKGAAKRWQTDGKPHGKAMANNSQTQTQTHTQIQKEDVRTYDAAPENPVVAMGGMAVPAVEAGAQPDRRHVPRIPEKPDKRDEAWGSDDFTDWANAKRFEEEGLPPDRRFNVREVAAWWSSLRMSGFATRDVRKGFVAFGNDPYWKERGLPLKAFVSQWEKYVRKHEVRHAG